MQSPFTFLLTGGMDLVTPRIAVPPGRVQAGVNFEPAERGYRRTGGYERFDGRLKPSEATYFNVNFVNGEGNIPAGTTVTGSVSGATGIVTIAPTVETGSFGGNNATGWLILVTTSGTFQINDWLVVGVDPRVQIMTLLARLAPTDALNKQWIQDEMERRRALIAAPPGQGPVRGVGTYLGDVYAFRNNIGATEGTMWKATLAGWVQVTFGETIEFTAGTAEIRDGGTLTAGAVTATINRVVLVSGTWSAGTAAGYIVISGRAGGDFAAGAATATGGGAATLSGASTAVTLPPGGKYRFVNHNFGGARSGERMYWATGSGTAFEFDGVSAVPIRAPLPNGIDKPVHLGVFAEHLFLAYRGGSILHSNIGNPRQFSATEDAGEHNIGTDPTNIIANAQTALVFFGKKRISYLTGSDNDTWQLKTLTDSAGAITDTAAMILEPFYVDDRGIRRLSATDALGDWRMGTVSDLISPIFDHKSRAGVTPTAAIRVRALNQYRLYFSDGSGVVVYVGRKSPECLPFELPVSAYVACSGEDALGREVLYVGGADGMVYQMDVGPSFDGQSVFAWMRLHFVSPGGTHLDYRWDKVTLEIDGTSENTIKVTAEYDYAGEDAPPGVEADFSVAGGGTFWDAGLWDQFIWDAPVQGLANAYLDGYGSNCSVAIFSDGTYEEPYTLSSARFLTTSRRQQR